MTTACLSEYNAQNSVIFNQKLRGARHTRVKTLKTNWCGVEIESGSEKCDETDDPAD